MPLRWNNGYLFLLLPLSAGVVLLIAYLFYYDGLDFGGSYDPPGAVDVALDDLILPDLTIKSFTDVPEQRDGLLVVDRMHGNNFSDAEMVAFFSRVESHGFETRPIGVEAFSPAGRLLILEAELKRADTLAIILPTISFEDREIGLIQDFIEKDGKVILIGDPARASVMNSIAEPLGFVFEEGFLYNLIEHELNYRNIFLRDFRVDPLTEGLEQITFYTAGSIRSNKSGIPIVTGDGNTYSSLIDRTAPFASVMKSEDGQVLAISDSSFFFPPRNTTTDNSRFIANIADFLTDVDRSFSLGDAPHFFRDRVDVIAGDFAPPTAASQMKDLLNEQDIPADVKQVEDLLRDTVFIGLYQDFPDVAQFMLPAGVSVGANIETPFTTALPIAGTGLMLFHTGSDGRQVLVMLADNESSLSQLLLRFQTGQLDSGLVSDRVGVFRLP